MSTDESDANKALVGRFFQELVTQRNPDVFDELLAVNATGTCDGVISFQNRDEFRANAEQVFTAFPDLEIVTIDQLVAEGDTVAVRWTGAGTQGGTFLGVAPTGLRVSITNVEMHTIVNGQIASITSMPDVASVMRQLNVLRSGPLRTPLNFFE